MIEAEWQIGVYKKTELFLLYFENVVYLCKQAYFVVACKMQK
jgi:hypothetical protein